MTPLCVSPGLLRYATVASCLFLHMFPPSIPLDTVSGPQTSRDSPHTPEDSQSKSGSKLFSPFTVFTTNGNGVVICGFVYCLHPSMKIGIGPPLFLYVLPVHSTERYAASAQKYLLNQNVAFVNEALCLSFLAYEMSPTPVPAVHEQLVRGLNRTFCPLFGSQIKLLTPLSIRLNSERLTTTNH